MASHNNDYCLHIVGLNFSRIEHPTNPEQDDTSRSIIRAHASPVRHHKVPQATTEPPSLSLSLYVIVLLPFNEVDRHLVLYFLSR